MSNIEFPLDKIASLSKLELDESTQKLGEEVADIVQLVSKIKQYPINETELQEHSNTNTTSTARHDVAHTLNRRGKYISLANENVGYKYYSVPVVIENND